jgi:hypothetical protein
MLIQIFFVVLAVASGLAVNRLFRLPASLATFSGLATIVVLSRWYVALGAPPWLSSATVLALSLIGVAIVLAGARSWLALVVGCRVPALLLAASMLIPAVILGTLFAGIEAPVSTHDGAFHVETIDNLRRGIAPEGWYPIGFHATAAAMLGLTPWLDSARGTAELGQGIILLAPLAIFSLALGLGLNPLQASVAAVVQALTYVFPYDNHLWGGWPLGMSLLLLLGLWAVAARWIDRPATPLAALGGLLAGAIVLTHGTEVYSAVVGLAVIAALKWRRIMPWRLARDLPLALAFAAACVAPYLTALVGWATGGGASAAGVAVIDTAGLQLERGAGGDWLEFVLGITGAAGLLELPLRVGMLGLAMRDRYLRVAVAAWATFATVLFSVSFLDWAPINWLFVATFPWLVHHRPPQLVIVFASMLVGAGLVRAIEWLRSVRPRLESHPHAWRRLALACGIVLGFLAEGGAVSVYKTLDEVIASQYVLSADDGAALSWLRTNARPGETVVNDLAADAGIWAPYKTPASILLPRSAAGKVVHERAPILANVLDLSTSPNNVRASACAVNARYVYYGAHSVPDDVRQLPERTALERAPALEEVFSSGQAAVFRIHLIC